VEVHGIKNDHRIVLHPQRTSRVDPIALPSGRSQLRIDLVRVIAPLAGDDRVHPPQRFNVLGVKKAAGFVAANLWSVAANVRGREKDRLEAAKIPFRLHPLHQDRTDHPSPADKSNALHETSPATRPYLLPAQT
jgi:hypothetical protein